MIYIFNSEQTSITKTRYFIMVDKLHWDLKLANFLRYLLVNLTFGIAMWQVFSTPDGEADVVGEIMDFAALQSYPVGGLPDLRDLDDRSEEGDDVLAGAGGGSEGLPAAAITSAQILPCLST